MMKKLRKNQCMHDQLLLSAAILTQWRGPVSSAKALHLLYRAMCVVLYLRIAMAGKTARKLGTFFIVVLFAVALAAARVIRSEYSSNGGIQWLLAKLWTYDIWRCTWH
jgi:hypothetical protein